MGAVSQLRRSSRAVSRRHLTLPVTSGLSTRLIAGKGYTLNGSTISAWADQSGNGNGASQGTAVNQPTAGTDAKGRPVVQFNIDATTANSDSMTVGPSVVYNAQALSVFIIAKLAQGQNSALFALTGYGLQFLRWASGSGNTQPQSLYVGGTNSTYTPHLEPGVFSLVAGPSSTELAVGPDVTTGLGALSAGSGTGGATLSALSSSTGFQAMDVYEVLVYTRAVSTAEAAQIRAWAAAAYSLRTTAWPKNVVFEGDSITQGVGVTSSRGFPTLVPRDATSNWRQTDIGTSGATISTLTSRATAADGYKRSGASRNVLHVLIGRNDVAVGGATAASVYSNLVTYVQARVAAGWEVWVGTCIASGASVQSLLDGLNALIRGSAGGGTGPGIVSDAGANRVIDYGAVTHFQTSTDANNTTYYQADSTHPTAVGAQILADTVAPQLT